MVQCKDKLEQEELFYHGSNIPPEVILKEGLKDPNPNPVWAFIWLTKDLSYAKTYGKYIYKIDMRKISRYENYLRYLGSSPFKGEEWTFATGYNYIPPDAIEMCNCKVQE